MPLLRTGPPLVLALILGLMGLGVAAAMLRLTDAQQQALDRLASARQRAEVVQTTAWLAMALTHPLPPAGAGPAAAPAASPEPPRQRLEAQLQQMAQWPVEGSQARLMAVVQASARRHLSLLPPGDSPATTAPALTAEVMSSRALLLDALAALAEEQQQQVAQAGTSAQAAQRSALGLLLGAAGLLLLLGLGMAWRVTHASAPTVLAPRRWAAVGAVWLDPAAPQAGVGRATAPPEVKSSPSSPAS
jgi:hypothetical protein